MNYGLVDCLTRLGDVLIDGLSVLPNFKILGRPTKQA